MKQRTKNWFRAGFSMQQYCEVLEELWLLPLLHILMSGFSQLEKKTEIRLHIYVHPKFQDFLNFVRLRLILSCISSSILLSFTFLSLYPITHLFHLLHLIPYQSLKCGFLSLHFPWSFPFWSAIARDFLVSWGAFFFQFQASLSLPL